MKIFEIYNHTANFLEQHAQTSWQPSKILATIQKDYFVDHKNVSKSIFGKQVPPPHLGLIFFFFLYKNLG